MINSAALPASVRLPAVRSGRLRWMRIRTADGRKSFRRIRCRDALKSSRWIRYLEIQKLWEKSQHLYLYERWNPGYPAGRGASMPISCQRQTVPSGFGVWGFDSLETCTTFPREVHRFADHEEDTLMPGCPAVIDLWRHKEITFPSVVHSNADISSENTWTNVSEHTMCVEKDENKMAFLIREHILALLGIIRFL